MSADTEVNPDLDFEAEDEQPIEGEFADEGPHVTYSYQEPVPENVKLKFLDADIADFLHKGNQQSAKSKEYEKKVGASLKMGLDHLMRNGNWSDAAVLIAYGDDFAGAVGELANNHKTAASIVDNVLNPIANPYTQFVNALVPAIGQLVRNHQAQIQVPEAVKTQRKARKFAEKQARKNRPAAKIKIPFLKKELRLPFRINIPVFDLLSSQSIDPQQFTNVVFSNERVIKDLEKRGFHVPR